MSARSLAEADIQVVRQQATRGQKKHPVMPKYKLSNVTLKILSARQTKLKFDFNTFPSYFRSNCE